MVMEGLRFIRVRSSSVKMIHEGYESYKGSV